MSSDPAHPDRAAEEAAQWFAKLNSASVSTADLNVFYSWRKSPDNDAAYGRVEHLWGQTGALGRDPAIRDALAGARSRAKATRSGGASIRWLGAGAGAFAILAAAIFLTARPILNHDEQYATAVGEQRTIELADGSRVRLDTNSSITVRLSSHDRSVVLTKGQAFFDVIHRTDQPFRVRAGDAVVRDLGTQFVVRREGEQAQITLVKGSVEVSGVNHGGSNWTLAAGQQLTTGGSLVRPSAVDVSKATSWTTGRLVFDDLPLAEATIEINRYAAHEVVIDAPDMETLRVSGTFNASDTDAYVAAVSRLYDLSVHRDADGRIVLSAGTRPKAA